VHPLQAGILRLRHPSERRPGLPAESAWFFWLRLAWETIYKHVILFGAIGRLLVWKLAIAHDRNAGAYMDQALAPVCDDDDATLDLLTKTTGSRAAVAHVKKVAELTGAGLAPRPSPRERNQHHDRPCCVGYVASSLPLRGADGDWATCGKSVPPPLCRLAYFGLILVHTGRNPRVQSGYRNGARAIILTAITGSGTTPGARWLRDRFALPPE
jgi:hypothetical protein